MRTLLATLVILVTAGQAAADGIDDARMSNRLAAAISRFPRYADTGGYAGASAGSRYSSAVNPAGSAFSPACGDNGLGTSLQYADLVTEQGTRVHIAAFSLSIDGGEWGVFQPSFLVLDSNRASMKDGIDFAWSGWSAEVQWSRKVTDTTAVGVNLSYLESEMDFGMGELDISEAMSKTYQLRLGVLHEFTKRFFAGIAVDYAVAPSRTRAFDFMGLGTGTEREDDTSEQFIVRPGIYTFLTDDLTLYADYQFATFEDDTGRLTVHRFYVGADQTVTEGLYARLGTAVDTEGNVSLALGLGIAPSETVYVDIAYQYDVFPELEPEFGRADLFSIGLTVLF
jgi:opacity protein-like surface antigen